jgi:hypothetical protein
MYNQLALTTEELGTRTGYMPFCSSNRLRVFYVQTDSMRCLVQECPVHSQYMPKVSFWELQARIFLFTFLFFILIYKCLFSACDWLFNHAH